VIIQKKLTDGLDFDEASELIEQAAEDLSFVHTLNGRVWYEQNEAALIYIQEQTDMPPLSMLSDKLNHLTPPDLRDKYGI